MNSLRDENLDKNIDLNISSEMKRNVSYNAIITPGEASESEEEEEYEEQSHRRLSSVEQSFGRTRKTSEISQSQRSTFSDDNSWFGDSNKYNTLLHRKLREKNCDLKRELSELCCSPYNTATKEVGNITKQLIQSQKMVQNVSTSLRKVSKELMSLEETIAAIKNDKNLLFNEFLINSSTESKESETNVSENQ